MAIYDIVAGTTDYLQFQLLDNGAPIDLSGFTVSLALEDSAGAQVPSPGTVTIVTAATGKVKLAPTNINVFDATKGPYYARWKLIDSFGKIGYVPSSSRDVWNIIGN
jgi:hypothetical protein